MAVSEHTVLWSGRERALRAFADLCAARGYAETSVADVVERAEISCADFADLFVDKEGCAIAIENELLGDVVAAISATYSADHSEWESLLLGIKAILEAMALRPSFAYFGFVVSRQMAPPQVSSVYRTGHQVLQAMMERGKSYSDGMQQPAQATIGLLGGAEAVVRREIAKGRAETLPLLLPDIAYGAMVAFLGQEEALRQARLARKLIGRGGDRDN